MIHLHNIRTSKQGFHSTREIEKMKDIYLHTRNSFNNALELILHTLGD